MSHRILIAGVWHETNTFSPVATDFAAFRAYQYAEGAAMIARYSDTNTEIGGAIAAAAELDIILEPALFAGAVPSGMVTAAAFEAIVAETVGRIVAFVVQRQIDYHQRTARVRIDRIIQCDVPRRTVPVDSGTVAGAECIETVNETVVVFETRPPDKDPHGDRVPRII